MKAAAADVDAQIADIKTRIAAAQRARVRAEHERDAATAQAERARAQLQADFGVSTVEDAKSKLVELEAELADALTAIRAELDQMGV